MILPSGDLLLTSFLNKSPVVMHFQLKCSAIAIAFSYLKLPGGPIKKTRLVGSLPK
jgi:hypothetical protein|tara:strand:- start:247 stop:414 length:168 start_codon:yes stop_codon:yes gene_type:complete